MTQTLWQELILIIGGYAGLAAGAGIGWYAIRAYESRRSRRG